MVDKIPVGKTPDSKSTNDLKSLERALVIDGERAKLAVQLKENSAQLLEINRQNATLSDRMAESSKKVSENAKDLSKKFKEVNEDASRFSRALDGIIQKITKLPAALDELRVKMNLFGAETNQMFGNMEKGFTDAANKGVDMVRLFRRYALDGKTTAEEMMKATNALAQGGVSSTGEGFDKFFGFAKDNVGILQIANAGYLELGDSVSLTNLTVNTLGNNLETARTTILATAAATRDLNLGQVQAIMNSKQLSSVVSSLGQSYKYLGIDTARIPWLLTEVAKSADTAKKARGGFGPSGAVAAEVAGQFVGNVANFDMAKNAYFGMQMAGGGGGGLRAGAAFDLMKSKPGGAAQAGGVVLEDMMSKFGGRIVGTEEASRSDEAAALYTAQVEYMKNLSGLGEQQSKALLNALVGGGVTAFTKAMEGGGKEKTMEEALEKSIKDDAAAMALLSQTAKSGFTKLIEIAESYLAWGGTFGAILNMLGSIAGTIAGIAISVVGTKAAMSLVGKVAAPVLARLGIGAAATAATSAASVAMPALPALAGAGAAATGAGAAATGAGAALAGAGAAGTAGTAGLVALAAPIAAAAFAAGGVAALGYKSYEYGSDRSSISEVAEEGTRSAKADTMQGVSEYFKKEVEKGRISSTQATLKEASALFGNLTTNLGGIATEANAQQSKMTTWWQAWAGGKDALSGVEATASSTLGGTSSTMEFLKNLASKQNISSADLESAVRVIKVQKDAVTWSIEQMKKGGQTSGMPEMGEKLQKLEALEGVLKAQAKATQDPVQQALSASRADEKRKTQVTQEVEKEKKEDIIQNLATTVILDFKEGVEVIKKVIDLQIKNGVLKAGEMYKTRTA